jgi:hypothetical protein
MSIAEAKSIKNRGFSHCAMSMRRLIEVSLIPLVHLPGFQPDESALLIPEDAEGDPGHFTERIYHPTDAVVDRFIDEHAGTHNALFAECFKLKGDLPGVRGVEMKYLYFVPDKD